MNKKKALIIGGIAVVVIVALIIIIMIARNNINKPIEIQYTDELNYVTYIDQNGDYVIEYENGDKTIETKTPTNE